MCGASKRSAAIVAMQAKVENMSANTFVRTFYGSLVEHKPIYRAIQIARRRLGKAEQAGDQPRFFVRSGSLLGHGGKNDDGILFPESDKESARARSKPASAPPAFRPSVPKGG